MDEQNLNSNESIEEVVTSEPIEQTTEQTTPTEQTVNADDGEVTTPKVEDKVQQTAEENAKYASIRREAEQKAYAKAQDDLIDKQYGASHNIHTLAEYENAIKAQEQQEKEDRIRQEYEAKGVPEELLDELVQSKKDREERKAEKETRAKEEANQKQYLEFATAYPDVKSEEITKDVWEQFNQGIPLKIAYAASQENASLKAKIAEYEAKLSAKETNKSNEDSSTGSITGNGTGDTGFISFETFESKKNDQRWVIKNLSKITESRIKW